MFKKRNSDKDYNSRHHLIGIALGIFVGAGVGIYIGGKEAVGAGLIAGYVIGEIFGLMYTKLSKK